MLPAVVDLDHIHADLRARFDLLHQKRLVDARVAVAAAPRIGEQNAVAPRPVRPDRALERHQRALPPRVPAAIDELDKRIAVRQKPNAPVCAVENEVLHLFGTA